MARPIVRLQLIQVAFALGFLALVGRAAQVQLLQGAEHAAAAAAQRTDRLELPARRGTIYDRNGAPLALTREIFHVGVAPNELRDPEGDARAIARQLRVPFRTVQRRLRERYAYFAGPYSPLRVDSVRDVRGVYLTSELVRFHPHPNLALSVLGHPSIDGRPASGIERVLDTLLTGVPGSAVVLRDRFGVQYESPARLGAFPVPGHDVYLTLDADLQEIVEQALVDALERYDAAGGDVVVLQPGTGEVLAMASRGGESSGALTSVFEPGSTAKLFAAAALLSRDLASPRDSVWTDGGEYDLNGRVIKDDHPVGGWLTLTEVMQHSSNVGMVKFAAMLTPDAQYGTLRDFGLGTPTGVEYPAESPGILKRPSEWSGTTPASLAMGYEVAVTPLQLAQAYAAVALDGVLVMPTLVREIRSPSGRVVYRHVRQPVRRAVSPEVAAQLRAMLRGVVDSGGTGETAALTTYEVAGKTGTARRAGPGGYILGSYTASFASLFPANDPQLVMVVKLDDPKGIYARSTAAPVTRRVLEQILASQAGTLDRTRLTVSQVTVEPEPVNDAAATVWSTSWPLVHTADSTAGRTVPDVIGQTLRSAANDLHRAGFRVRVVGWGSVASVRPAPGSEAPRGSVVTITARGAADRR